MIISALHSFLNNTSKNLEDLIKSYPIVPSIDENGNRKEEILNKYSIMYGEEPLKPKKKIL